MLQLHAAVNIAEEGVEFLPWTPGQSSTIKAKLEVVASSDGSGPKKSSQGRAQALNVKLGPGPGLSPSLNTYFSIEFGKNDFKTQNKR